ncbi:MAG: hypothetical protein NTZ98_05775 [Acidobacteria bacterium]|jgi:hypothetical protein|nr:hypothetical protein [Acidobacteriota bacterium]
MFIFEDVNRPEVIRRERLVKRIIIGVIIGAIVAGFLYWELRDWPEERTAKRFLATLQRGDYQQAYRIWQPSSTYAFNDFLRDWGPNGEYGKVQSFKVVASQSSGSGVIVTADINGKEARIWVERKDKSLSFPPY